MAVGVAFGGPRDGEKLDLPDSPTEVVEIWGEWVTPDVIPVRRWRKVYLYEQDAKYRHRLAYVGEQVVWDDEEVTTDGTT